MSEHVIELNGKRYDAMTGKQLDQPHQGGRVIDGVVRKTAHKPPPSKLTSHSAQPQREAVTPHPAPLVADIKRMPHAAQAGRRPAKHAPAKRPMRSQTLMRNTVKQPKTSPKPAIKPQAPAEVMAKPVSAIARKHSVANVDSRRMERAIHTPKHGAITRFHHQGTPVLALASAAPVPVISVQPLPERTPSRVAAPVHPPHKAEHPPHNKSHDIFEAAMHRAASHKEPLHHPVRHRKMSRKLINSLAGVGAFIVIAGFIGYLNMPALEVRVASIQAGFHASIPDYTPTGYALADGVERVGGTVSVSFRSGANNYTITQQASDWNSQTLLDNTLALNGEHATIQKNGQTIYVYGEGTSAAWVNGGIRYDLTGNATLSKDDIAAIATSL